MKRKYLAKILSLAISISVMSTTASFSAAAAVPEEIAVSETSDTPVETITLPAINITAPSAAEAAVAHNRSFYISGTFTDLTAAAAQTGRLVVEVKDSTGKVVKTVTGEKYKPALKVDPDNGLPSYYDDTLDIANDSKMPDLIWDGVNEDSFHNPDIKCYFDETEFTALVSCGNPDWINDQMSWNQNADAIPASDEPYTVAVTLYYTPEGDTEESMISAGTSITIGSVPDKIMSRFSPSAHAARINAFAAENNYRIYNDPFPGYWSKGNLFCEIKPEFRAADAVEYSTGKVHFIIYNVKGSSTTYSVELAALQNLNSVENPDRLVNYYYEYGEPELNDGTSSRIVAFDAGDKLEFTRTEILTDGTADNIYDQDSSTMPETDLDLEDGVEAEAGDTLALYGVTAPIQIDAADIVSNGDNSWNLNNKISRLHYDITGDGVDADLEKEVNLDRQSDGWSNPSELEFKSNIPIEENYAGKVLTVSVTGYDTYGTKIDGTEESFQLHVADNSVKPGAVKNVKTASATNAVTLSWGKVSNAAKYQVFRYSTAKEKYIKIAETQKTSYTDGKRASATKYQYKIRAVSNTSTPGNYSNTVNALTKPVVPRNTAIKRIGKKSAFSKAQISFDAGKRATGYYIYQYIPKSKSYKVAYKIAGTTLYSYNRSEKKYTKIGTAKIKNGKMYAALTKINLKTKSSQSFKVRAYKTHSGCEKQLSGLGHRVTVK